MHQCVCMKYLNSTTVAYGGLVKKKKKQCKMEILSKVVPENL